MLNVVEDVKYAALAFVNVAPEKLPSKSTVQNHEHRREDCRSAISEQPETEAMQYADQCDADDPVLDEHRIAQARAHAHKHRGNKVGEKRISEARAGKRRIFRRKILTVGEARDDAQVKGQVAVIIQHTGVQTIRLVQQRAIEYQPHDNHDAGVKKKVDESPAIGFRAGATDSFQRLIDVEVESIASRAVFQQDERNGEHDCGSRDRDWIESKKERQNKTNQRHHRKTNGSATAQTRSERRAFVIHVTEKRAARDG